DERAKRTQEKTRENPVAEPHEIPVAEAQVSKTDILSLIQLQEREAIRLLLNYAEADYEEQKLSEFMLTELDEVEFSNPVFGEIYNVFKKGAERNEVIDTLYFM